MIPLVLVGAMLLVAWLTRNGPLAALGIALVSAPALGQIPGPILNQSVNASFTGTGDLVLTTNGYSQVNLQATGSGSGMTFAVQGTFDGGTTWHAVGCVVPTTPGTFVSSMSANGYWSCPAAGYNQMRLHLSGFSTGTEVFWLNMSLQTNMNIGQ